MQYDQALQDSMNKYNELKARYDEMVMSEQYNRLARTMPFDFISARQTIEKMAAFNDLQVKPQFFIKSAGEAVVFSENVSRLRKQVNALREDAMFLNKIAETAEQANVIVRNSPFMDKSLEIAYDKCLTTLAYDCLASIQTIPRVSNAAFRKYFVESCLYCLKEDDMTHLTGRQVLKPNDVGRVSLPENQNTPEAQNFIRNLKQLCLLLNQAMPIEKVIKTKIKGVSFKNDDGTDRQQILQELAAAKKSGSKIALEAKPYLYNNEEQKIFNQPAVLITWNGHGLGNLPKELAEKITEEYPSATLTVDYGTINAFENEQKKLTYGMEITLHIKGREKKKEDIEQTQPAGDEKTDE